MGLLKSIFSEARYAVDSVRRDFSSLRLKMELFVASYDGQVVGSGIPISSARAGVMEDNSGPISFYVREEFTSGVTSFVWFHTNDGALQYIEIEKKRWRDSPPPNGNKLIRIVGPYKLPWGKDERFN